MAIINTAKIKATLTNRKVLTSIGIAAGVAAVGAGVYICVRGGGFSALTNAASRLVGKSTEVVAEGITAAANVTETVVDTAAETVVDVVETVAS